MWESEYVPWLFSPDWAPILWGFCLAGILALSASRYRPYVVPLARGLCVLVILQSLVLALGLAAGDWLRHRAKSPNDAYVAGATCNLLIWVGTLVSLARKSRTVSPLDASEGTFGSGQSGAGLIRVALVALAVVLLFGLTPAWLILVLLATSHQGPWTVAMLQGAALGPAVLAIAIWRYYATPHVPGPAAGLHRWLSSSVLALSVAVIVVQMKYPVIPPEAMTDSALAAAKGSSGYRRSLEDIFREVAWRMQPN